MFAATFLPLWTLAKCTFNTPQGLIVDLRLVFDFKKSVNPLISSPIQTIDYQTGVITTRSGSRYHLSANPHQFDSHTTSRIEKALKHTGCIAFSLVPEMCSNPTH